MFDNHCVSSSLSCTSIWIQIKILFDHSHLALQNSHLRNTDLRTKEAALETMQPQIL